MRMTTSIATMASENGREIFVRDGERDLGADPRKRDVDVLPTLMASDATTKNQPPDMRHHHVPDQGRHGEGRLDPPEAGPGSQAEHLRPLPSVRAGRCAATGRS